MSWIDYRRPHNPTELRRALSIKRAGIHRDVYINSKAPYSNRENDKYPRAQFEIHVHSQSTLTVTVWGGLPFLKLRSGHVEIQFRSSWGNSLEMDPGTTAKVIVPNSDTKVTISGDDSGLELVLPESGHHRVLTPSVDRNPTPRPTPVFGFR